MKIGNIVVYLEILQMDVGLEASKERDEFKMPIMPIDQSFFLYLSLFGKRFRDAGWLW